MSNTTDGYKNSCCGEADNQCEAPTTAQRGKSVGLLDQYNCPIVLEDKPCAILSTNHDPNDPRPVSWNDGSKGDEICLDNLKKENCLDALVGLDGEGNLSQLAPNNQVYGIQVPEYIEGEWKMVGKGDNAHCFQANQIKTTTNEQMWGIAAFEECQSGTVCLSVIDPCEASKVLYTQPGTVMLWAGCPDLLPTGYTILDGKAIPKGLYPDLFAKIGYEWGGSGDVYRLPDMRGRVARGVDYDEHRDTTARFSENDSSPTGLGSYQDSRVQCHSHEQGEGTGAIGSASLSVSKSSTTIGPHGSASITYVRNVSITTAAATVDVNVGGVEQQEGCGEPLTSSEENTMHNAAMYYIISTGCKVCE